MTPLYTYVYPLKAIDQYEAPQVRGQRTAIRPWGQETRDGGWSGFGHGGSTDGLGGLLPLIAGAYGVYWGCKNGYLPADACKEVSVLPGKEMPGTCPDAYKLEGQCFCPAGSETADGGCMYPDAYQVDPTGALPIGGGAPPEPKNDPLLVGAVALAVLVGAVLVFKK